MSEPAVRVMDGEVGPQLLPDAFRRAGPDRPTGAEVILDLVEGQLDLPAFPVERDELGRRVPLRVQQGRAEEGHLVVLRQGDDAVERVLGQDPAFPGLPGAGRPCPDVPSTGTSRREAPPGGCRGGWTSSPSRDRARHNDDRFTLARARLPGMPLVSTRSTSSYDSRANRHRARTRYTTSRAGRRRRRRSARSCLAVAASTSSAVNTFVRIPIRARCPAPHPVTPRATPRTAHRQLHWPAPPPGTPGARRAAAPAPVRDPSTQPAGISRRSTAGAPRSRPGPPTARSPPSAASCPRRSPAARRRRRRRRFRSPTPAPTS